MTGFIITDNHDRVIRFRYYVAEAPATVSAFAQRLPFTKTFVHARVSGHEFWTDDAPSLNVSQENASVFTQPGEAVIGPANPTRTRTAGCMGIYYGEGRGLDACNIFAKVFEEDLPLLQMLGNEIWRGGERELTFSALS